MKLGILSDTHDEFQRTEQAVELLKEHGAEGFIHCGDLTSPKILELMSILPSYFVFGNHDCDRVPELEESAKQLSVHCLGWGDVVKLHDKWIGVVHGHLRTDLRRVLAFEPDYLLFGHFHFAMDQTEDGTRKINPGAIHQTEDSSVALLDLESDEVQFLTVD